MTPEKLLSAGSWWSCHSKSSILGCKIPTWLSRVSTGMTQSTGSAAQQQPQRCLCLRHLNGSQHEGQVYMCCMQRTLVYNTDMPVVYYLSKDKRQMYLKVTNWRRISAGTQDSLSSWLVQSLLIALSSHFHMTYLQTFPQDYILLCLSFVQE